MDNSLAKELYSGISLSSNEKSASSSATKDFNGNDIQAEDGSLWGDSDEELPNSSELDWEWQRRHDQFHTLGYRDGLIAGKEASAQEGFNVGFNQSVFSGYNWGITRGVSSTLASLPDELRERLIETQEKRDKFKELHESVNPLSSTDALKLFHEGIMAKKATEQSEHTSTNVGGLLEQNTYSCLLEKYNADLQSLLHESPAIKAQFFHQDASNVANN